MQATRWFNWYLTVTLPPLPFRGGGERFYHLEDTLGNKVEAAIVGVAGGKVELKKREGGGRLSVPLERLTPKSRKIVEDAAK